MNVLKPHLQTTLATLLARGASQREIERITGIDRKTVRTYQRRFGEGLANSPGVATGSEVGTGQIPPPRPPAPGDGQVSACEPHRAFIEAGVRLGRNAMSLYQDLVETHGFTHRYNSVKRFVATLKRREPERFDVLEFPPGEEAQVDYGQGALTVYQPGTYKRPHLFVMTLKYSGKSFRKVVWKADQMAWAQLHEEAWRHFGGSSRYVVIDNLKTGVLRPDIYAPELNPVYAALLAHYGVVADPCRVRDPNRKGTVESAIQHTQGTALKGRKFDSLAAQNAWLAHWEERWAAPRIHGRKKRQVLELYAEERGHLQPLPLEGFRSFRPGVRTVDDAGLVQIDGAYYAALPAALYSQVEVRIYTHDIEIRDAQGQLLRRHAKVAKGHFQLDASDRLFNPSRETTRLMAKAERLGPNTAAFAQALFARVGRPGQRALYGLVNLTRHHPATAIDAVCQRLLAAECVSYAAVKQALARDTGRPSAVPIPPLTQSGPAIRPLDEYQRFWEQHARTHTGGDP